MRRLFLLFGLVLFSSFFLALRRLFRPRTPAFLPRWIPGSTTSSPPRLRRRVEADIRTLAGFGTRNTFSDTLSDTRGIGAARRWIKAEFDKISADCGGCLEVFLPDHHGSGSRGSRRKRRGGERGGHPARHCVPESVRDHVRGHRLPGFRRKRRRRPMPRGPTTTPPVWPGPWKPLGSLPSTPSRPASSMLASRPRSRGCGAGSTWRQVAVEEGWEIVAVLNNDMIGNTEGIDGIKDNTTFRVFSEPNPCHR